MANNILFYFTWQIKPVHFGIVIEKLQSILDEEKDANIYFLICDGGLKPCYTNREGDPSICSICTFNSGVALKPFNKRIKVLKTSEFANAEKFPAFDYNSVADIKNIKYKDVSIGYGALSSYISFTRNLEPIMDNDFRSYFDKLLLGEMHLTDTLIQIIEEKAINRTYFFNGRTADTRPLYDISKSRNIPFVSLEMVKKKEDEFYIMDFVNCLPHDIDFRHQGLVDLWNNSPESMEEKIAFGKSFYEKRRGGQLIMDRRVYTAEQEEGRLPENFDPSKKNIAIFVSSEDEFAAIGDVFEKLAVFKTQEEGITKILERFKGDESMHFYVRIHPNLKKIKYAYHTRMARLGDDHSNCTVIQAASKISTYAMIDACDTAIVFGSSTGAEACYWGKPVILLAGSFYYHLDVAYKPQTPGELYDLLQKDLEPKPQIEAIKYSYYLTNYEKYTRKNKFSPVPIRLFGKKVGLGHHHLKVFGSKLLFRLAEQSLQILGKLRASKKLMIPRKGI
jgi:hypothetical protein